MRGGSVARLLYKRVVVDWNAKLRVEPEGDFRSFDYVSISCRYFLAGVSFSSINDRVCALMNSRAVLRLVVLLSEAFE